MGTPKMRGERIPFTPEEDAAIRAGIDAGLTATEFYDKIKKDRSMPRRNYRHCYASRAKLLGLKFHKKPVAPAPKMSAADISGTFREFLRDQYPPEAGKQRLIEEFKCGMTKNCKMIDFMVINHREFIGFEVKSDLDFSRYDHLNAQIDVYNGICNRCYIVTSPRKEKHCPAHIPDWWGIIIVDDNHGVRISRESQSRPDGNLYVDATAQLLYHRELINWIAADGAADMPAYARACILARKVKAKYNGYKFIDKNLTNKRRKGNRWGWSGVYTNGLGGG